MVDYAKKVRKTLTLVLAIALVAVSPGLAPYRAAAQTLGAVNRGAVVPTVRSLPTTSLDLPAQALEFDLPVALDLQLGLDLNLQALPKDAAEARPALALAQNAGRVGAILNKPGQGAGAAKAESAKAFDGFQVPKAPAVSASFSAPELSPSRAAAASAVQRLNVPTPELPLDELASAWRFVAAENASLKAQRTERREESLGEVADLVLEEPLTLQEFKKGAFRRVQAFNDNADFSKRETYVGRSDLKNFRLFDDGAAWLDENGVFHLWRKKGQEAHTIVSPSGQQARAFEIDSSGGTIFVRTDSTIEKWSLVGPKTAKILMSDRIETSSLGRFDVREGHTIGVQVESNLGRLNWTAQGVFVRDNGAERFYTEDGQAVKLERAGRGLYLERGAGFVRAWSDQGGSLRSIGKIDVAFGAYEVKEGVLFAAAGSEIVEWDLAEGRWRTFSVPVKLHADAQISVHDRRLAVAQGSRAYTVDLRPIDGRLKGEDVQIRLWSQANPMRIEEGKLWIGNEAFPLNLGPGALRPLSWPKRVFYATLGRLFGMSRPRFEPKLPLSGAEWKALNLPTNKKNMYDTLRALSIGQRVLYIGETGGGKTWIANAISKLMGHKMFMISMTEYIKESKYIERQTFGEEGEGKTGVTDGPVLQWMREGGLLVLDEMHKPIEGIAVTNNIIQNAEYRKGDGTLIKMDTPIDGAIGTMNPAKPPYKGEPPSGELSSRFGATILVNYLPMAEETALLKILASDIAKKLARRGVERERLSELAARGYAGLSKRGKAAAEKAVAAKLDGMYEKLLAYYEANARAVMEADLPRKFVEIAKELRKVYPETIPIPVSTRTLLFAVEKMIAFPDYHPGEAFTQSFNPGTIVEDEAIEEAVQKAVEAKLPRAQKKTASVAPKPDSDPGQGEIPF